MSREHARAASRLARQRLHDAGGAAADGGSSAGARQRRAVTDQVMEAIRELSGQEYVSMYASARKEQLAAASGKAGAVGGSGQRQDKDPVV